MKNFVPNFIIEKLNNSPKSSGSLKAFTMFIDISGFTSMTQNLMNKGKEGSEILTTIINNIFTPSIKSIYDHNGFITTFAGDAFTAVFPKSKSSIKHLLSSAFEINQIFVKIGNQNSRLGNFQLEVKIGLSFGNVKWKIVSNKNQNAYYFQGDAINNCAFSEHRCEKGDIVFDKELLPFIKNDNFDSKQIINEINHYLIKPSKIIGLKKNNITSKKINTNTMSKFVPKEIMQTKVKGEFRDIVSCFISFQESNIIDNLITHILNLAAKYGGYLNKVDFGDKGGVALVLFGAPTVKEKLFERANNFILEIQELDNFSIRTGITFGKVFAGFVGSEIRSEYTALGEIVNLSARFMMKAKWGQNYLDRRIYTSIKDSYNIKELAPEKFKGISGKIPTFLLLSKKQTSLEKQFTGKIFGRNNELAQLNKTIEILENNKFGGLVYVDGIAGIGKSRLIYEFKNSLKSDDFNWFFLPCDEILRKSFNPFAYFFSNYFNQLEGNSKKINRANFETIFKKIKEELHNIKLIEKIDLSKSFLAALIDIYWEDSLYEKLDPKNRYDNTLFSIKTFFQIQSSFRPTIIEIDDGHWIDDDSERVLEMLTKNVGDQPFAIISACRFNDDESEFSHYFNCSPQSRIVVEDLGKDACTSLIKTIFTENNPDSEGKVPKSTINFINQKSGGNPFYVEQISLYLFEHKLLDDKYEIKSGFEIPLRINIIIIARIDRLTEDVKEVIKTASVIGKEFVVKILSEMLKNSLDDFKNLKLSSVISQGKEHQIWNSIKEIKYIFKHALIRTSVYEIQLKARLRVLHKLAAETIEVLYKDSLKKYYEELAYHFEKAEIHDKAEFYLKEAANKAKYEFRNMSAISFLERQMKQLAIMLGEEDLDFSKIIIDKQNKVIYEKIVDLMFELKYFLANIDKISEADKKIVIAMNISKALKDEDRIAKSNLDYAEILKLQNNFESATKFLKLAENYFIKTKNDRLLAFTYSEYGIINYFSGHQDVAQEYFEKQLFHIKKTNNLRNIAEALGNLGVIFHQVGKHKKSEKLLKESLKIVSELNDKRQIALNSINMGSLYDDIGQPKKAIEHYNKAIKITRDLGLRSKTCLTLDNLGYAEQSLGNFEKGLKLHQTANSLALEINDIDSVINTNINIGNAYKNLKKLVDAEFYYDKALTIIHKNDKIFFEPEIFVMKAEILFDKKDYQEALDMCNVGIDKAKKIGFSQIVNMGNELLKKIKKNI